MTPWEGPDSSTCGLWFPGDTVAVNYKVDSRRNRLTHTIVSTMFHFKKLDASPGSADHEPQRPFMAALNRVADDWTKGFVVRKLDANDGSVTNEWLLTGIRGEASVPLAPGEVFRIEKHTVARVNAPAGSREPIKLPARSPAAQDLQETINGAQKVSSCALIRGSTTPSKAGAVDGNAAVVFADAGTRIHNTMSSNDGYAWGKPSARRIPAFNSFVVPAMDAESHWVITGKPTVTTCQGEWQCVNPNCKLQSISGCPGKFSMVPKSVIGGHSVNKCQGIGGSGCGSEMKQVSACDAKRWRYVLSTNIGDMQTSRSCAVYVYRGQHAPGCLCHRPGSLLPDGTHHALPFVPPGVSPAKALALAGQSLLMAGCLARTPEARVEHMAALASVHANPDQMKAYAKAQAAQDGSLRRLKSLSMDKLSSNMWDCGESIVAYHLDSKLAVGWKGTVLVEGILREDADVEQLCAKNDWRYSQAMHLLSMCDDDRALKLMPEDLVERMQKLYYHFDCEHPDVILGSYSNNSCTYDPEARAMIKLCSTVTASESAAEIQGAKAALDVALRTHLGVLSRMAKEETDWSTFSFQPRNGHVLDEGYGGQKAHALPDGSGQVELGCQQHFRMDLERRTHAVGGTCGKEFKRLMESMFLNAALPAEFAMAYVAFMDWGGKQEPGDKRRIMEFVAFWLHGERVGRVATAFRSVDGPKAQMCEIMHSMTQHSGRKGKNLVEATLMDLNHAMQQRAFRHKHFASGITAARSRGKSMEELQLQQSGASRQRQRKADELGLKHVASHRCDRTSREPVPSACRIVYSTHPRKGESKMISVLYTAPSQDGRSTEYAIQVPGGATQMVAAEAVAKGDKLAFEISNVEAGGTTNREAAPLVNGLRTSRFRTSVVGGSMAIRRRNGPLTSHARNVDAKVSGSVSVDLVSINWVHTQLVELEVVVKWSQGDYVKHTVTIGHEPKCCCLGMCTANAPDSRQTVVNCAHCVIVMEKLLDAPHDVARLPALLTSELEPLLAKAAGLWVSPVGQEKWGEHMLRKRQEGQCLVC